MIIEASKLVNNIYISSWVLLAFTQEVKSIN